jgi:ribonucleoside-diphosphate reductase alpha chain
MPGLLEEVKKKVNRPVPELLPLADDTEILVKQANAAPVPLQPGKTAQAKVTNASFVNMLDAPPCPNCGHVTVRNGACFKCLNCGESLGCS